MPVEIGSHMEYLVKGKDRQGPWEGKRRFTHFYLLAEALNTRWPGVYLPRLPPKKAIGRFETLFLQDRRYYLERFLRKLGTLDYIMKADEFVIFSRPNGDIEKVFQKMTKLPTSQLIERYRRALQVNEAHYDANERKEFSRQIHEVHSLATTKLLLQMKDLKKRVGRMRETKGQALQGNKRLLKFAQEYEDLNLSCYETGLTERLPFEKAKDKPAVAKATAAFKDNMWNPFDWLYYWCKGEIYDLKSLVGAIDQLAGFEKQLRKTTAKKFETAEDLGNMQEGKTTMRTVFKSSADTGALKA